MFRRSRPWTELEYWALDLETSGLDAAKDRILSIGMVPIRRGTIRWGDHVYRLIRPERPEEAATGAIAVHQILPEELATAPDLEAVVEEIAQRLSAGALLVVHYAPLDVPFLQRAFRQSGYRWPRPKVIDTQVLASRLEQRLRILEPYAQPLPRSLGGLRQTLGLPEFTPHHALWDALATAELFLALRARLAIRTSRQL